MPANTASTLYIYDIHTLEIAEEFSVKTLAEIAKKIRRCSSSVHLVYVPFMTFARKYRCRLATFPQVRHENVRIIQAVQVLHTFAALRLMA